MPKYQWKEKVKIKKFSDIQGLKKLTSHGFHVQESSAKYVPPTPRCKPRKMMTGDRKQAIQQRAAQGIQRTKTKEGSQQCTKCGSSPTHTKQVRRLTGRLAEK